MSSKKLWYMNEGGQYYSKGALKKKIEDLEKNLNLGEEEFERLNKAQLIQKISIIGEIIKTLKSLILECEKDDEEGYQIKIDDYTQYEQELQDYLDSFDRRKHNETGDAESWNEFKKEEEEREEREER